MAAAQRARKRALFLLTFGLSLVFLPPQAGADPRLLGVFSERLFAAGASLAPTTSEQGRAGSTCQRCCVCASIMLLAAGIAGKRVGAASEEAASAAGCMDSTRMAACVVGQETQAPLRF